MNLIVKKPGIAVWNGRERRCALGRNGIVPASDKREGDGKTPAGLWPMRRVLYRADRLAAPQTKLRLDALEQNDAWCDIVGDPMYNQMVKLPYPTRDERLWRTDGVYDMIVVLGHNDAPVAQGKGSAVFLHIARPDFAPTAGCVALGLADMLDVLAQAAPDSVVEITPE